MLRMSTIVTVTGHLDQRAPNKKLHIYNFFLTATFEQSYRVSSTDKHEKTIEVTRVFCMSHVILYERQQRNWQA